MSQPKRKILENLVVDHHSNVLLTPGTVVVKQALLTLLMTS